MRHGVHYRGPQVVAFARIKRCQVVAHGVCLLNRRLAFLRRCTLELASGFQPIIKLITSEAATLTPLLLASDLPN